MARKSPSNQWPIPGSTIGQAIWIERIPAKRAGEYRMSSKREKSWVNSWFFIEINVKVRPVIYTGILLLEIVTNQYPKKLFLRKTRIPRWYKWCIIIDSFSLINISINYLFWVLPSILSHCLIPRPCSSCLSEKVTLSPLPATLGQHPMNGAWGLQKGSTQWAPMTDKLRTVLL